MSCPILIKKIRGKRKSVIARSDPIRLSLNPPKSIYIKGQTSWTNSYAYREKGGGGMMG